MIPFNEKGLSLIKKFAAGVSCEIDFDSLESAMFYPPCEAIAKEQNLPEITEDVVKKYILKIHNDILIERFKVGNLNSEDVKSCMVYAKKVGNNFVCFHGNGEVMSLTELEANFLREKTKKILESLH